ncbi:FMN reductase [Bacteroidia bacterium]|nr:FMN reductase [Bacteroidia bacterium]
METKKAPNMNATSVYSADDSTHQLKVILVNGSPNEKGCTYTALSEVASALEGEGIAVEIFHIGKNPMQGCTGCRACKDGGGCVFEDIVNEFVEKAKTADGFIFGSPVYYSGANGSMVSFLNRVFYSGSQYLAYKPGAAVVSARRAGTTATLQQLYQYFTINNMPLVSSQYWCMVHGNTPDEVRQDLEGMQIMRTLGKNMAWLLKNIEAGKAAGMNLPEKEQRVGTNFIR